MKKYLLLFMMGLLLAACGDKKETPVVDEKNKYNFDTTDVKTTEVQNPNETFSLNYNFKKDETYTYRVTTISETNRVMEADTIIKQSVNQIINYLLNIKLLNKDEDGLMDLTCTFTSIKVDANANEEKISFESSTISDSLEKVKYADYLSLINNSFEVRINKEGELLEIGKTDKIVNTFLKIRGLSDSAKTEDIASMKGDLGEIMLKPILVQVLRKFPDKEMAKDSTWSNVQPASKFMVFDIVNTTIYKIANLEQLEDDKLAVIDADLKTLVTGNNKYDDRGIKYEFKKPVTSASGKIYFNIEKGCLQKSKTKTIIDIFYTMEMPTPQGLQKGIRTEKISNTNIVELL